MPYGVGAFMLFGLGSLPAGRLGDLWGRRPMMLIFFFGMVRAFMRKEKAANNPWGPGATTLEWTLSSPPPFHQFEVLPRVQ